MQKRLLTNHDQAYLEECARCKVSYLENQKLTDEQKLTARQNIGISDDTIQQSIDSALLAAKESGEFDGYTPVKGVDYFDGEPGKTGEKGDPGKDGYTPIKGIDYFDGKNGRTPVKGIDYFDGAPGKDGAPGEKGDPGYTPRKGVDYVDGKDGYTPKKGVDYFDGKDGYTPVKGVDYTDGYTPQKGIDYFDGKDGRDGIDGHTPVLGEDYWTDSDKAVITREAVETVTENVKNARSVLYLYQSLADKQKTTARSNISAAGAIVCSATGEEITLTDSSDQRLEGLKVFGKSTQNGTPTPSAPVPIESVGDKGYVTAKITGKNLFGGDALADKLVELSKATKDEEAGTVFFTGVNASGGKILFDDFKPDTRYTFIFKCSIAAAGALSIKIDYTDGSTPYKIYPKVGEVNTIVFVSPVGKSVESLESAYYSDTTLYYNECGIFEGVLTANDFEPYKPEQTLTVYTPNGLCGISTADGGWVRDEIDFARGVRVQRIGKIDSYAGESVGDVWISSTGELSTGATVYYVLAEPVEGYLAVDDLFGYMEAHTNKPSTIISNDAGAEMKVSYAADTKLYIDNKFAELSAAILNNA